MLTYTKFSHLSLAAKIRLHEKFTSEIFHRRKYPDLRYALNNQSYGMIKLYAVVQHCGLCANYSQLTENGGVCNAIRL